MSLYKITVKPGTSQEKILESAPAANASPAELIVYLRSKPHDGEANDALIKLLAKHFKAPKTSIKILRGAKSRIKIIEI